MITIGNAIGNSIGNPIGNTIGNCIHKWHFEKWHFELNMKWNNSIKGFTGLRNTLGTLLDKSQTIKHIKTKHKCGCMYADTIRCMYADFGCMSMEWWVQSMRLLGAKYAETLGCMYAVVGCKSMERLGACMRLLGASVWSGWVHAWQ